MIKIKDLTFSYNKKMDNVLTDINIEIPKGKWISIVGHNGSGKSTLSKILVGLLPNYNSTKQVFEGKVTIDGIEVKPGRELSFLSKIGIVFQNPDNQFVGGTVEEDIAFGLENSNVKREEMIRLIDKYTKLTGMSEYLDVEPHNLSGGQKQRVAIAGLLAMDRDYMIFDEATSMLDPNGKEEVVNFIKEISEKMEKTVITITHDLDVAAMSDLIVFLNKGKVERVGTPEEVFSNYIELENAGLDIPFPLKVYYKLKESGTLDKNQKIGDYIWELFSMM